MSLAYRRIQWGQTMHNFTIINFDLHSANVCSSFKEELKKILFYNIFCYGVAPILHTYDYNIHRCSVSRKSIYGPAQHF
jgi:hypothetical protein